MNALIQAARKYTGVRWRHRGRNSNGLDCAGLPWAAYKDCGEILPDFRLYGPEPHNDGLIKHITIALGQPVKVGGVAERDLMVGDVVVMRLEIEPHHVGIVTDYPYGKSFGLIHADGHYRRVIEHRLTDDYINRITHLFRKPL